MTRTAGDTGPEPGRRSERDGDPGPVGGPTRVGVVVPAAGSGRRMGGVQKPFLELAGQPVLVHALRPFLGDARVVAVVVVLPAEVTGAPPSWLTQLDPRIRIVAGGRTRGESVERGLAALPADVTVIAIHDGARPLVTPVVVGACIDTAVGGAGAVAGCPAVDTMKTVDADGRILATPPRESLWHAHTPQVFPAAPIRAAYAHRADDATDDAALVEHARIPVVMVDDGGTNLKVTRPGDVVLAEAILGLRAGNEAYHPSAELP